MKYYVADAFAEAPFAGNPAGVCVMDEWPEDSLMQSIAAQNNLAETAFILKKAPADYDLKWFTPRSEVDLCGHATLASAFVIMNYIEKGTENVRFSSRSGPLYVEKRGELYVLDFPSRPPVPVEVLPEMERAIGAKVLEAHGSRDLFLLVEDAETVRALKPDMALIERIPGYLGVCATAKGGPDGADFVSRFFAPVEGIPEDPVTGSAHSCLIPYWAGRLGKKKMTARQLSARGGVLYVEDKGDRVGIAGKARLYLSGEISV